MTKAMSLTLVWCCLAATGILLSTTATSAMASVLAYSLDDNAIEHSDSFGATRLALGRLAAGGRRRQPVEQCNSCGPNQCQVMGMQRYAEPVCDLLGGLGSPCRMWQEPENKTLHFPNKILQCNEVYMQFCPCSEGLVCEEAECRLPSGSATATANSNNQNDAYNLYDFSAPDNDVPVGTGNVELPTGRLETISEPEEEEPIRATFQLQPERRYSRGPQWPSAQHLWNLNRYY